MRETAWRETLAPRRSEWLCSACGLLDVARRQRTSRAEKNNSKVARQARYHFEIITEFLNVRCSRKFERGAMSIIPIRSTSAYANDEWFEDVTVLHGTM